MAPRPASAHVAPEKGTIFSYETMSEGQSEFCNDAMLAARDGKILLANAPTGIGKTAAALSILGESMPAGRKVIFLTIRDTHHLQAIREIKRINERCKDGLGKMGIGKVKAIDKTGKGKMCFLKSTGRSQTIDCEELNLPCKHKRPKDLDTSGRLLSEPTGAEEAIELGKRGGYCAHFAALDAVKDADVVVCDYSYIFDESVRARFLEYLGVGLDRCDLIIDEAHNLAEKMMEFKSYELDPDVMKESALSLSALRRVAPAGEIVDSIDYVTSYLKGLLYPQIKSMMRQNDGEQAELTLAEAKRLIPDHKRLLCELRYVIDHMEYLSRNWATERIPPISTDALRVLLGALISIERKAIQRDDAIGLCFQRRLGRHFRLRATLFDPAPDASRILGQVHSAILMSGTLPRKELLAKQLGLDESRLIGLDRESYPSPFDPELQPVLICADASSKLKDRWKDAGAFRSVIRETASAVHPNGMAVYYPSYEFMEQLRDEKEFPEFEHFVERSGDTQEQRAALKASVEDCAEKGIPFMLHSVMRGSYSEGIDFRGNPFKAIIVAGFPMNKFNAEQKAYGRYLERKLGRAVARHISVTMPAMIRTNQAIGRGIRNESDRCACILVEPRFLDCAADLQPHLRENVARVPSSILRELVSDFIRNSRLRVSE
ncbi:ATP-dependent DNA helicase [uncultured archaeon]|nr:ATP-dependent DNA helicase [uncultured archaeon]